MSGHSKQVFAKTVHSPLPNEGAGERETAAAWMEVNKHCCEASRLAERRTSREDFQNKTPRVIKIYTTDHSKSFTKVDCNVTNGQYVRGNILFL